ncbi:Hypothetical protein D9617_16g013720 [Elsinoe fawcettii]|nr:Hypothetical protein D9617_16g013720 [Elsinoe fawcettii]
MSQACPTEGRVDLPGQFSLFIISHLFILSTITRLILVESDPQPRHLGPNFYYPQEDLLKTYCDEHPETKWNVIRPWGIIGAVEKMNINALFPLAFYAAVQARKNEPLVWWGDFDSWQAAVCFSTARLTGYLSEWAVLEEDCANEAFNAHDDSPLSPDRLFEELARWYGAAKGVEKPDGTQQCKIIELPGGADSPLGYGPTHKLKQKYSLLEWTKDPANRAAWEQIKNDCNGKITLEPFTGDVDEQFMMGDLFTGAFGHCSLNKVRRYGFNGFVDTLESMFETAQEMVTLGQLPYPVVDGAQPLI